MATFPEDKYFDLFSLNNNGSLIKMCTKHFVKSKNYNDLVAHMINIVTIAMIQSGGKFNLLVDMEGTLSDNVDIGFFKDFVKMMVNTFPDSLKRCEVHSAPGFLPPLFNILKLVIPKETVEKIHFIKNPSDTQF